METFASHYVNPHSHSVVDAPGVDGSQAGSLAEVTRHFSTWQEVPARAELAVV